MAEEMKSKKGKNQIWMYDGNPEQADLIVGETTQTEGGYVLVIELANGLTRLAATRHPAKYVSAWHQFVKRYGLPEMSRMIVSKPHLRYEAIKRGIAKIIEEFRDEDLDAYRAPLKTVTDTAEAVIVRVARG